MRLAAVLTVVLLVSLAPPAAAQTSYAIEATLVVVAADEARLEVSYTYSGGRTSWSLNVPRYGATFLDAREADGGALSATVSDGLVRLTTPGGTDYTFTLRYAMPLEAAGPYLHAYADVAAAADSPVRVGVSLPAGWSVAGWRANGAGDPYEGHVFVTTGPALIDYLLLPAPFVDAPPAEATSGDRVVRSATAHVTADSVDVTLAITYDADHFSPSWQMLLDEAATGVAARTPYGALEVARVDAETWAVEAPYPSGYGLGARTFELTYSLPAPAPHGGAFVRTNLSVAAGETDVVRLAVTHDDALRLTGWDPGDVVLTGPLAFGTVGPATASLAFLPPAAPGHVQFTEGLFVVDVPQAKADAARVAARNATAQLLRVAPFAAAEDVAAPFFVAYTQADIFSWEEGFYSPGLNTISIRLADLDNATAAAPELRSVSTLVHETVHGLADRILGESHFEVSLLDEGLARLAEARLEEHFADQVVRCSSDEEGEHCSILSSRPNAAELQAWHRGANPLPVAWGADGVDDEQRGFLYDYSGLVFNAYDARTTHGALRAVLVNLSRQHIPEDEGSQAELVVRTLLAHAPGTSREALLYPGREAAMLHADEFRHCLGDLVAPGFPWDPEARAPAGGCPATGYGGAAGQLPAPPPADDEEAPAVEPPVAASPAPLPPPPPTGAAGGTKVAPAGDAPAIHVDGGGVAVPAPGAALALAAVALCALAAGRRLTRR